MATGSAPTRADVEQWMQRLYVGAEGASLRREDARKAVQVAALLGEIARAVPRGRREITLVDAAAGKSYVGILAAKLVLEPTVPGARVVTLERDRVRAARAGAIAAGLQTPVAIECRAGEVNDPRLWPDRPDMVAALHACGAAADEVLAGAVAAGARRLLLVPCCTSEGVPAARRGVACADDTGIPRHAAVRRRFVQAMVDAERTLRLEAAGYETEVVELVPPTVTPHNLVWRARRVGEPGRMARAAATLARLVAGTGTRGHTHAKHG
jgi:Methyltransferase domain